MAKRAIGLGMMLLLLLVVTTAQAEVYCNITAVEAKELSNGVQITVKADGILRYSWGGESSSRLQLTFYNAKNLTEKNFLDVSKFPVSHLELRVPQGASEGVGVEMTVALYEPSTSNVRLGSDQQSVIVTINSKRTLEKKGSAKERREEKQEASVVVTAAGDRVSVAAVQADIHKLLAEIAAKTGTNIAVDDSVQAEVNLHLKDLPARDLLTAIASAYGLALSETNGVYMFSKGVTDNLCAYRLSGTSSFPMRYTRAQDASGLLPTFLYSYLHVNQGQNAVVVTAPQQMLDKISTDLKAVDIAPPQILIEAIACEFTDTQDLEKLLQGYQGDLTGSTTEDGLPDLKGLLNTGVGLLSYATLGALPDDFELRLRLLETEHKARVRAAPRMAVMNGHQANLFIGVRRFIRVEYLNYGQTTEKIQGVDVGVKLKVTPLTGGGGEITLNIDPQGTEVSNVSELDVRTGLPVLSTRQAGTTVRVKNGETVMLGGLSQRQSEDRRTKIPILGDLPLVGTLFQSRATSEVTSDLVVFITPHLLTPDGRLADEAQERAVRQRFGVP